MRSALALLATVALVLGGAVRALSGAQIPAPPGNTPDSLAPTSASVSPESPPRAVHIDAIVTDPHGKPIVNLRAADFAVYENDVPQKIDDVELKSRSAAASGTERIDSPADEERAAREPGTRVVALYLDEFHVGAGPSTEYVRRMAARFLDEQLRPGDLAIVMKPLDNVTTIRFTRDRDALRQAVSSFSGRKDDYAPRTGFEQQYMGRSPGAVGSARAQIVISGLRALTMRMGELDGGRAGLVLFSEGFSVDLPRTREQRLPDVQGLVRAASRYNLAFYALDPGPPPHPAAAADAELEASKSALRSLAVQTGGEAIGAGQDLASAIARVSRDLDTYYVLTYMSSHAAEGRFYNVKVQSSRRDAQVRARTGYWAPFRSDVTPPLSDAPLVPLRALRRSPLIESWVGVTVQPDGSRRVIFTWTPASTTAPVRAKPGVRAEVVKLTVSTVKGSTLFDGEVAPVRVGAAAGQRIDSAVFAAPPGRIQLDLVILRSDGTRLDTATQDVDLPDLSGPGPIILPPQLFRAGSARDFRELSVDPSAPPTPLRSFRRTDRVLLRVPVHPFESSTVTVAVKNRVGQVLRELEPVAADDRRLTQFDLPLAWLSPGEYAFEIAATTASGTVRQLIRFLITG